MQDLSYITNQLANINAELMGANRRLDRLIEAIQENTQAVRNGPES
jgi:hypothetical protein